MKSDYKQGLKFLVSHEFHELQRMSGQNFISLFATLI